MRRMVGRGKKKVPAKTLGDTSKMLDERVNGIDGKADALNKKIRQLKFEINKLPKGSPARAGKMRRAKMLLKQKKMYENQGDMARNQQFNMDMQNFNLESMTATVDMVKTMKTTKKQMGKAMKKINIDKVADLKDDLDDIMMDNNEIQDMLGDNPMMDDLDEDELDAELEALDEFDEELIGESEQPDYLQEGFANELPAAPEGGLDKYGLPAGPVPVAEAERTAI